MFIVTLSRFIALVAPYESMRKRPTDPSSSINAYYERAPPHFLFFKAIKRTHFLFAFLIFCILLANILTVAFGGLFLPKTVKVEHMHSFDRILSPLEGGNRPFLDVRPQLPQGEASMYFPLAQKDASLPRWTTPEFFVMPFQPVGKLAERYMSTNTTVTAETWGIGSTIKCHEASNDQVNVTNLRQVHRNLTTLTSTSLSTEERFQVSPYGECAYSWNSTKTLDSEYEDGQKFHTLGHYEFWKDYHKPQVMPDWLNASKLFEEDIEVFEHCPGIFSAKFGAYEVKTILPQKHIIAPVLSKALVLCNASPRIARVRATVDLSNNVKNLTVLSEIDLNIPGVAEKFIIPSNLSEYLTLPEHVKVNASTVEIASYKFQHFLLQGIQNAPYKTRTDARPQTWLPYLISQESPKLSSQPYGLASADPAEIASALESVYKRVFVSWLQTYEDELFNKEAMANKESVTGSVTVLEDRYKVETAMFWIVVTCLGIFVLLLVYFYIRQPGGFLKHIPTTLAATIPLVYASTITRELRQAQGLGKKDLEIFVEKLGHTYGYGWFEGTDGEKHLGVDKEPILRRRTWEEMVDMGTQFVGKQSNRVEVNVRGSDDWEAIRDGSQQTLL